MKLIVLSDLNMKSLFSILDPGIKFFLSAVFVLGPLCIIGLFLLLKRIEKDTPEKIRWR